MSTIISVIFIIMTGGICAVVKSHGGRILAFKMRVLARRGLYKFDDSFLEHVSIKTCATFHDLQSCIRIFDVLTDRVSNRLTGMLLRCVK